MPNITTVFSVAIFIVLGVIFWKNFGVGSGRSFGNKIAKHTGLNQNTFWYLMDNGSKGPALDFLKSLEQSNMDLDQASIAVGPTLQRGIERLEARFGTQTTYEAAKPIVAKLMALQGPTPDAPAPG